MALLSHRYLAEVSARAYNEHTHCDNEVEVLIERQGDDLCLDTERVCVIAFRGTEANRFWSGGGWRDVIRDIRIIPWYDKRIGWAHAGFLKGARNMIDRYILPNEDLTGVPIVMCGHSLGGALAMCAGVIMDQMGYDVIETVAFGAPRAFKRPHKNKRLVSARITNYRNSGDLVTNVPWNYSHPVELRHIGRPRSRNLADHHITKYLASLGETNGITEC